MLVSQNVGLLPAAGVAKLRDSFVGRRNTLRFELIDQILERDDDHIVAIKNVTSAEEYLQDHFPSFAVLPGVMMLETLVQAARKLMEGRDDAPIWPLMMKEARNVRYGNMVRPGQTLKASVQLTKVEDGLYRFEGVGHVGEQVAVQARFVLIPVQSMFDSLDPAAEASAAS